MSHEIKCPHCKTTGIITYGFFAVCASEDCAWIGPISSVGSKRLMTDALLNGFSPLHERIANDAIHSATIKKLIEEASKEKGVDITIDTTMEADRMGSINVYAPTGNVDTDCVSFKLQVLKTCQNMFLYPKDLKFKEEDDEPERFDKFYSCKTGENSAHYEEYGFPPIDVDLKINSSGVNGVTWSFSKITNIWQPIDWSVVDLSTNSHIHYLAVLQIDGQNFTYFANEDLHTGEWKAGISTREFGSLDSSIKLSSAATVEEAVTRLTKHFDSIYNKLIEDGDPVEVSWSKSFDYGCGLWSVCCAISTADIFKDDCSNEIFNLLGTNRREEYARVYEESFAPA